MKIAAFLHQGQPGVGIVSADLASVQPFELSAAERTLGALPVIERLADGRGLPALLPAIAMNALSLTAPLPKPRRNIFCVGKNYFEHAREFAGSGFDSSAKSGGDIPAFPIYFSKVPESVVIGKGGKGISKADALKHVWGYTIINDVTARDWQGRHSQWLLGKSFDTFCPMGPWLVSADELDGTNTRVRCYVNDELRQDAATTDLIFDIPTLIETLSAGITIYPGDLIATGTPVGVGIGFKPPKYLTAGDVVRVEIDGIGVFENPLIQRPTAASVRLKRHEKKAVTVR